MLLLNFICKRMARHARTPGRFAAGRSRHQARRSVLAEPGVDFLFGLFLLLAVPLLQSTGKTVALAFDLGEVGVREVTPGFLHPALHLCPVTFNLIPIHVCTPLSSGGCSS